MLRYLSNLSGEYRSEDYSYSQNDNSQNTAPGLPRARVGANSSWS